MTVTSFKCPNCGADLQVEEGRTMCFCNYCGTQIHIDDGTIRVNITKRIVDEARLRELDLQEQNRIRQEANESQKEAEAKKKITNWWTAVVVCQAVFAIIFMLSISSGNADMSVPGIGGMVAAIILSIMRPDAYYLKEPPRPQSRFALFWALWIGGLCASLTLGGILAAPFS